MKKLKIVFIILACLMTSFSFFGCDEQIAEIDFRQETIEIRMGEVYNPLENLDYDEEILQYVTFSSGDKTIFYITPNSEIVGVKPGFATLYAYYKNVEMGYCIINVLDNPIQFEGPVGLTYDYQEKNLKWEKVYAQSGGNMILASSYTVEISINDGLPKEYKANDNKYGPLTQAGSYKIRVKTNGGGIYLESDYTKNNLGEYKYLSFVLMAQPLNLSFDNETSVLTWDVNNNPEDTRYKVFVNGENKTGSNGIAENNFILNISEAGTYSVSVEAFNSNIVSFPSRSETLELHTLKSPELSFNNGILSWQTNDKASGFEIVLENDLDEWTYQIAENTYNFSELAGGGYTVKVRALGNQEINSFTSEFSDYQFTKLDSAELVFNSVTGIFAVNNNGFKNIEIVFETNGSQIVKITNNYVFDFTDTKTYSVKARILASDVTKEIDGEFSQFFTLTSDAGQQLTKIKNLSVPILNYGEDQNKSYIGFEIIDENCDYTLLLDNEPLNLNINMNIFNLGLTDDFFIESRIYPFKLIVKKDIMDDTVFINKTSLLNIEKLSAPQTLGLIETSTFSNMQVEVKDDINFNEVVDISILINGVDTNVLNLEQDNFEIIAKFLAKTDHQVINGIRTFYISGETNIFNIQKLETVEDLNFNYSTKKFSWSSVQNAESYKVFINGIEEAEITNTNIQIDLEESYQLTLFAVPEEWISIESGEIGYIFSTINYDVYKVGEIRNLYLEKDDMNNLIKVNWTAPNNIPVDANVYYKVFLNTELISNLITENTFDIEFNLFALAGEYVIKIQIVDNDNEFFPPSNNNANIALIKLSQVNQIERNILEVSARNFNVGTMLGVKFNGVFDGDNTYDLSGLVDGDKLELNISYVGRFNKNLGDYYLDSSPSKFTIYKLNAPTDLNYNDGKFTWGTSDDLYEGFYDYGFYTITNGIKNSGTTTNLEKEITSSEEYEFFVFENASLTWSVITAGGIGFLNSSEVSFKVFKENDIENFKMSYASDEELLLTWDYTENADLNSYIDYEPEFALTIKKGQITIEYLDFKINEVHLNENHYSKTIDISAFESEIDYNISIIVQSSKSLSSEPKEIIITKLNAVNFVEIDGTTLTFLQSETKEISLDGASGIVLSGDIQTNVSEKTYDLSGLVPNTTYAIDMMVLAISPETVLDGHYYINSLVTTFVLTKINDLNPTLVAESNKIEWEQRDSADYYNVKIETPSGEPYYIENIITDTFINLDNLIDFVQEVEVGVYKIYVKAVVETKVISPNPTASPDLTGFLGNDYEKFAEFEKLAEVQNIEISASPETTQQNVIISWDAANSVLNSDADLNYEIWCSNELTGVGELINCVSTTSYTTSTDFNQSGDYYIWIKVKSNGYIESEISNKKRIVKLEAINQFNINASSLVLWNQSTQVASGLLDYSYIFQIFDADNNLISTFGDIEQIKNNSYDLSTFEGLKNYGGKFSLKIFVKGNGSSETQSGITTLSSAIYSIDAYKFFAPEISINGNVLSINCGENSLTYSEKMEYHFTIEKDGEILKNLTYQSDYELPNEWLADEYTITAYITAIQGENNLVKSKTQTKSFIKLNEVLEVKAEATDDMQNNVKISWNAVENATGYNIYVNETLIENAIITIENNICFYETDVFNLAGVYEIQVQAKASEFISSKLSNVVEVIRLNPISNIYTDAQMNVFWEKTSQESSYYSYVLNLIDNSGQNKGTVEVSDVNATSSEGFLENNWLLNELESGNFSVKIIVVGNGSSDTLNVLTLTSAEKIINAYKFKTPEISVVGNELKIETSDTGLKNKLKIIYSIKKGDQSLIENEEYDTSFIIPSDWEAGEYEITAYVTAIQGENNLIKSNISELTIGKLNVATDLKAVATTPDDLTQKSVTLSWTKSTDATSYDIYVNGELKENVITSENTCSYITSTLFSDAGEYIVKVVAKSAGKISSDFSESITIVRLNAIEDAYVDSQAKVFWTSIFQGFEYTYSLQLLNNAGIVMHSVGGLDIDATSSDAFVNNDWLLNEFVSGNFNVKIIVVGNGSSETSNVLTLTSAEKIINAYKFVAPTISVIGDELKFETGDTGLKNKLKIIYSIKKGDQSLIEDGEYDTSFIIPSDWEAGNYEITAYVTAIQGENNLIKSNISELTIEKLNVATDLKAVATTPDDLTQKSVTLSWTKSTDATSYDIYVNGELKENVITSEEICSYITSTLFSDAGEYIVKLVAKSAGKISSDFSESITIVRVNSIMAGNSNSEMLINWVQPNYNYSDYTYYLELLSLSGGSYECEGTSSSDIEETLYAGFADNAWLEGFEGGLFAVSIRVIGNGSSDTSNVLTLSSAEKIIQIYKFIAPTISVIDDEIKIETDDIYLYSNKLEIKYTIKINGSIGSEQVYESPFIIPSDWEAGEYEITAYVAVKDDNVNLIKSNISELTIEKLDVATNLKAVATNSDDLMQESVTLSWTESTGATTYDIYVNNVFETNVIPTVMDNICSYVTNTLFNTAGEYIVELVAKNENKISSDFSSSITIVRLNAIEYACVNSQAEVSWTSISQGAGDLKYTYSLRLVSSSGVEGLVDGLGVNITSSDAFVDNEWLLGLTGGEFNVKVIVVGNGSSETSNVLTLTSAEKVISAYKFIAPTIKVENDELKIETTDIDLIDKLEIRYVIKINENTGSEQVYENPFIIPNNWETGEYEITAYVTVKDDNVNLIKSNITKLEIEKLDVATELKAVATTPDDLIQESITLSWVESENATTYDIYVNNIFETNVTPDSIENNICSYETNIMFNTAGEYIVKLVAKNENKISSDFSTSITIVRLNAVETGSSNSEMLVNWVQPGQFNNDYTYYLELLRLSGEGYECEGESNSDIIETLYAGFADNTWLESFEGGLFAVGIRVIGNGSSENDLKVATFSSEDFYISILKLYAPAIFTLPEYMEIVNTKVSEETPSGTLISNIINTNYSIKTGEDFINFAKNAQNNDINNIVYDGNYFYYPNNWASGEFEFTAFSYPNASVLNVIPSNETVKTAIRLEAPQNLHFIREAIIDFDIYSDDELMEDNEYFSENVFFKYDSGSTSNIYGYKLFIESEFMQVDSNVNLIRGNFETFLSKNPNVLQTLNVIALGGDDNYINSPISSINFTKLKSVERFYASEGIINWTGVENNSAYLVKLADEEHEPIRFWQGSSSITSSYLTGILGDWVSGQIALNIKAIGNVGTDGRDGDGIILDSTYMVDASNNSVEKEFFKLEQPKDFETYLGYLICNSVGNAMNYRAIITSKEGETLYDLTLDDFTARLELASDRFFAGHTEFLYSLETETLYRIQLQAISTAENIIYSDFSETLNFKVLENANGINDIGLSFASNGMLDQTRLGAYVSANSYGLLRVDSKGSNYITVVKKTEEPYSERQKLDSITIKLTENSGGKYLSYEFACLGSSEEIKIDDEEGFYYLTSKSTKSDVIYVLETPSIRIENGIIKWDIIEGCDGYYVYISSDNSFDAYNLYKYKGETETYTYPLNYLELPDNYGGDFNNEFFIKIIAVSDNQTILYSYGGEYYYNLNLNGENTSVKINPIKLKKPEIFKIVDGALVFDEGFSGLNDYNEITHKGYNENTLRSLFNNFETIQDFKNLQKYLQELLSMPVLTYSQYTGFTFPNIELCFTKVGTSQKYLVTTSSEIFLKMNSIQFENFNNLISICKVQSELIISELQSLIAGQTEPERSLLNLLGFYTNFNEFLYSNVLNNILNIYNKEIVGWPSISMLFDEIDNEMHQIPSGNYELRIRQLGNSCDWLNSNFKYLFDIHIPRAPGSAEIVEREGNFYLLWNEVSIPSGFNYSPISSKYILYGEDASGNRYEIIRTNGDSSGTENGLQISLTELIEENVLKEHIIKIYMVVAGDNGRVISGLTSRKINISILPVISPSMEDGILVWNSLVSAKEFEIIARTEGYGEDIFITENNYWAGEELTAETTYNILVRAIGDIYRDNDKVSYVLTGKTTSIKLSKLNALNVDVNKYGIFEWNRVQNANGFAVYLKDTDLSYIYNDNGLKNTFESLFEGYHTYLFIAMGTTGMIDSDSTVYYLNSRINNDGNGLRAGNLPGITNIRVEDGIIKFNPLGEVETVEQGQSQKVVGYRLMISNGIETLYSTDLPKEVFFTDSQGNMCFDFSIYGNEDTYDISIQPYIYYINPEHTVIKNAQIINDFDGETYQLLLGKASTFEFDKIAAPTSVKILNGQLTWTEIEGCEYVVEVYTITGSLIIERVITNSWWTNSSKITDGTNYYVKVKAYLENDVYSVYTTYCDANANPILITRLAPINVTMNSYTESEENFITFDFPSSGITPGFNIQYKTSINGSYKYVYVTDSNYNEIVQYSNNKAIINISKISDNIELMYYQLQVVPMGLTNYFKSNWSSTWEFSIPNMIDDIYYDADNIEYYWVHDGSNSYIIKDEVLDANDNVIATYKYSMKSNSYASETYYKEREVMIDGILTTVGTVAYMPSIPGYKHRISVAVSLDSHAEYSLMSLFKPCDTVNWFNLFSVEKDILQSGSELYQSMNPAIVSGLLKNNAYGSESNSYLIKNTTDFTNINKRLNRYNYTHTYIVELCYVVNGNGQEVEMTLNIEEDIPNYCFKQTVNLSGITAGIGKYQTSTGGTLSYKNFNNTYDGNGKTISYSIKATTTNLSLGLFLKLDANAVVKNLKVNAIIDFNAIQNSTFTYGAVAGENNGNVYNCQVLSISVLNLISGTNSGVKNLTFGGVIGENKGTIELCILNNITLTLQLANNEEALYVGGIAGKNTGGVIKNSGNNAKIQVTSKKTVYVGGIAGSSSGNVQQVYNKGTILVTMNSGSGQIGGLIGFNNTSGKVANSYNTGSVNIAGSGSPTINLGGLVGYTLSSDITNSYSTLAAVQNSGNIKAGTLVGLIEITIPAGFQLSNYYINDAAVGNYSGSIDVFAKKLTVNELKVYALNLNNAAGGDPIFKNTSTSPCFVWE